MRGISLRSTITPRISISVVFLSVSVLLGFCCTQSSSSPGVILEVINRHFTVGLKIPSLYLRVLSDGTAECHKLKYSGNEAEIVKKSKLAPDELGRLEALLGSADMLNVKKRYELMHFAVDSWMEWDIQVPHRGATQEIQVLNFSPESARERNQAYPDALVKLGCSIRKVRHEVYGDEPYEPSYLSDDCKKALANH